MGSITDSGESQAFYEAAGQPAVTGLEDGIASMSLSPVNGLQTENQRTLLDAIDALRAQHIEGIDPIQLIVCGGQSTGKSSVLEALSGIPFPRGETLCTRFASEIVLRRDTKESIYVSIQPHEQRSAEEIKRLEGFSRYLMSLDVFPDLIKEATQLMGLGKSTTTSQTTFARDILHIEVSGPKQPHLTLVDLPGIIHTTTDEQNPGDPDLVSELVRSYMEKPSSIILAVVTASTDFGNQIVFDYVRELDKEGKRTLGIITKLDRVRAGSADERSWLQLAQNKKKALRLGWHVVRNVDTSEQGGVLSLQERDTQEEEFFRTSPFRPDRATKLGVGIPNLRERLSVILLESIQDSLEPLQERIGSKIEEVKHQLRLLGNERSTLDSQRLHLLKISEKYSKICDEALKATYDDEEFFNVEDHKDRYLCAKLKTLHEDFRANLCQNGQQWRLANEIQLDDGHSDVVALGRAVPWLEWIDDVCMILEKMRGHNLRGSTDDRIMRKLFVKLSKPWGNIASTYLRMVRRAINTFINDLLAFLTDDYSKTSIQKFWLDRELDTIYDKTKAELDKLIASLKLPLMTSKQGYADRLKQFEQHNWLPDVSDTEEGSGDDAELHLTDDESEAKKYIERLLAYYLTVRETFIDNIPTLAIWSQIMKGLPEAFSSSAIGKMDPDEIQKLGAESEHDVNRRKKLREDLEVLKRGFDECERQLTLGKLRESIARTAESQSSTSSTSSSNTVGPTTGTRNERPQRRPHRTQPPVTPSQHPIRTESTPSAGSASQSPASSHAESVASVRSGAASAAGTAATSPSPHPSAKVDRSQQRSSVFRSSGGINPLLPSPARLFDPTQPQPPKMSNSKRSPFAAHRHNTPKATVESDSEGEL